MLISALFALAAVAGVAFDRRRRRIATLAGARRLFPRFLLCLPMACVAAGAPLGADSSDWAALKSLRPGTRIEVVHGALQRIQGTLSLVDKDALTVQTESGLQTLPRQDVQRVSVPATSKKKRILTSMAIGAAAGAAFSLLGAESGDIDIRRDYVVGAGAAVGAAAGVGVGALTSGPRTIYRAR